MTRQPHPNPTPSDPSRSRKPAARALGSTVILGLALAAPLDAQRSHQEKNTTIDSAGVRIVTSKAPIWDRAAWTVGETAELDFGGGGQAEQLLHEVGGMISLPNGRTLFSNGS